MLDSLGGEPSIEVDKEEDEGISFDSHCIIVVTSVSRHPPLALGWVPDPIARRAARPDATHLADETLL